MTVALRLSLRSRGERNVIICICRGKSERHIARAIENGATTVSDFQLCGIGDQCGSCHVSLRSMLVAASAQQSAPCPAHLPEVPAAALTHA